MINNVGLGSELRGVFHTCLPSQGEAEGELDQDVSESTHATYTTQNTRDEILEAIRQGHLSIGAAAKLLNVSIKDVMEMNKP